MADDIEYFFWWKRKGEWLATGLESGTAFSAIDLQEGEWFDYDEKAGEEVSIKDLKWEIRRAWGRSWLWGGEEEVRTGYGSSEYLEQLTLRYDTVAQRMEWNRAQMKKFNQERELEVR